MRTGPLVILPFAGRWYKSTESRNNKKKIDPNYIGWVLVTGIL